MTKHCPTPKAESTPAPGGKTFRTTGFALHAALKKVLSNRFPNLHRLRPLNGSHDRKAPAFTAELIVKPLLIILRP